jgi:putative SOS response-associated peptidase YedK
MRWGFKLPDWLLFNARSDNLSTSPFWKERLNRRCIVPAGSMLEWKKTGTGPRPKYRLSVKGRHVLGMAGIWGSWLNPKTGKWEDTFAIIASDPNTKVSEIHNRQAVILEPREYAEWLAENERPPLHLLRILPDEDMMVAEPGAPTKSNEPPTIWLSIRLKLQWFAFFKRISCVR